MKKVLLILFALLWVSSTWLCLQVYPEAKTDRDVYAQYIVLKDIVYEWSFLVLLVSSFFTPKKLSRAFLTFLIISVFFSIIDKMVNDVITYTIIDGIIHLFAVYISYLVYKNGYRFERL